MFLPWVMRAPPPLLSLMIEILNKHISSSALGIKKLTLYLPTPFLPALGLLSSPVSWACVICASVVVSHLVWSSVSIPSLQISVHYSCACCLWILAVSSPTHCRHSIRNRSTCVRSPDLHKLSMEVPTMLSGTCKMVLYCLWAAPSTRESAEKWTQMKTLATISPGSDHFTALLKNRPEGKMS